MEKKTREKIPVNLHVSFLYDKSKHTGIVTNLSNNYMYIKTKMCFYFKTKLKVFITLDDEMVEVLVKVNQLEKKNGFYDGMGVKLLGRPKKYLKYVDSLKIACM
jgi:hypothetical protein